MPSITMCSGTNFGNTSLSLAISNCFFRQSHISVETNLSEFSALIEALLSERETILDLHIFSLEKLEYKG